MALRLRRGTDAERQIITPAEGELVYVTDTKELYIGDGTTVGGIRVTGEVVDTLNGLSDVDAALPQDGDILVYDSLTSEWESVQLPLADLPDVNALSPNDGDILRYDSDTQVWVAVSLAEEQVNGNLEDLDNVVIAPDSTEPTNGQTLLYDSQSGVWYNGDIPSSLLSTLTDVEIISPENNQALLYDSFTGSWYNGDFVEPSIPSSLQDLDNVLIAPDSTEPTNGQVLVYDSLSNAWFNSDVPEPETMPRTLQDLTNVVIAPDSTEPTNGQVLMYDSLGEAWFNGDIPEPNFSISDLLDVNILNPSDKDVLLYDELSESWYTGGIDLESDIAPQLGGNLNANGFDITNIGILEADSFVGDITGSVFADSSTILIDSIGERAFIREFQNVSSINIEDVVGSSIDVLDINFPLNSNGSVALHAYQDTPLSNNFTGTLTFVVTDSESPDQLMGYISAIRSSRRI